MEKNRVVVWQESLGAGPLFPLSSQVFCFVRNMVTNEEAVGMVAQCLSNAERKNKPNSRALPMRAGRPAAKPTGGKHAHEQARQQQQAACAEACRLMLRRALTRWTQYVGRADNVTVCVVAFDFR